MISSETISWLLAGVAVLCAIFYLIGFVSGYKARVEEEEQENDIHGL